MRAAALALLAAGLARADPAGSPPASPYALSEPDGAGFTAGPGCPRGTVPLATPNSLRKYRCVNAGAGAPGGFGARWNAAGGLSFDVPAGFRVQDAWKDDVPTLYLELDAKDDAGKPASITITRNAPGQEGFAPLAKAVARDVSWQGAREIKPRVVAGARSRATEVAGTTLSVYLPAARDSYYAFVFSAPENLYAARRPDFERLLKSVKLERP